MCGICGVIQLSGEPRQVIEPHVLMHMTDAMTHRGPNERGLHQEPGIALGVRRLSIMDVAAGQQPFADEAGEVWAIQNGELYNHNSLRAHLQARGHQLRTRCDTEIIPHLYEDLSVRFVDELRGMFGIAAWDGKRRRTVLARDRLGVKPLYWAQNRDVLVFASELKSLLASGLIEPDLDYDAIDAYLTLGFVPGPRTLLARVSKLMAAHRLVVENGGFHIDPYWSYPESENDPVRHSEDVYAGRLLELLDESVRMRLMSDVPLGAMLSGGLDSSLIVALMARNMSSAVKTFSVGFSEDDYSELEDARYVSSVYGTDHHELELSFHDSIDFPELVWSLDEPLADLSALGFKALSELASRHVTVALSGQGADELLGGYKKHRAASLIGAWERLPSSVRKTGEAIAIRGPRRFHRAAHALAAADAADRLIEMSGRLGGGRRQSLYRGPLEGRTGAAAVAAVRVALGGGDDAPLPATLRIDTQLALVDSMLHYFDRTSMANSLEVRVPFLDHHVVEFCAHIPADLKVRRLQTKHVLKRAARDLVPDHIVHKRKLGFFSAAVEPWLQTQLSELTPDLLFGPEVRCGEFLDRSFLQRIAGAHTTGADLSNAKLLTAILMLEIWLRTYVPRALAPAPLLSEPLALAS
jgi:asparagine synthase (glutamine-hydrolysing)